MVTPAFARGHQDVAVRRLSTAVVRPDDDSVVAVEVAEGSTPRLVGTV